MNLRKWRHVLLGGALCVGLSGCTDGRSEETAMPAAETGPVQNLGIYDNDVDTFLDSYVREDQMFADDNLQYEVRNGLVTVTGSLDSQEELSALQTRIRRVPGVREMNVSGVNVGG